MSFLKALIRNSADRWATNCPSGTIFAEFYGLYEKLGGDGEDVVWAWKQQGDVGTTQSGESKS